MGYRIEKNGKGVISGNFHSEIENFLHSFPCKKNKKGFTVSEIVYLLRYEIYTISELKNIRNIIINNPEYSILKIDDSLCQPLVYDYDPFQDELFCI